MGQWEGKIRVTSKDGRPVVVDEWAFPRQATLTFEGEGDAPDLAAQFEYRPEGPVCVSLAVTAKPGGRPVTDADVQWIVLEKLAARTFATAAWAPTPSGAHVRRAGVDAEALTVVHESSKDERLVQVARRYLVAYPSGAPLAAVEAIAPTRRTAARWVASAREAGLIPPQGADAPAYADALARLTDEGAQTTSGTVDEVRERLSRPRNGVE